MFLNLGPYMTWLGIMLTSKPHDLQNRINHLNRPTTVTPPHPTTSKPITTAITTSTVPTWDLFICNGRPSGRYPHARDCSKYFVCHGEVEIVKPSKCPNGLHFSPTVKVCTLPQDAGCRVDPTSTTPKSSSGSTSKTTLAPIGSNWLKEIQSYHKALDEERLIIYYDNDVSNPTSLLWPIAFIRTMWTEILMMYGSYGSNNRLYVLLRGKPQSNKVKYGTYLDETKGFINAIEVGSADWSLENSANTDMITLNIAHIVVRASKGIRYPGPEPGWVEIFVYDLYERSGRRGDSARWEAEKNATEHDDIASIPIFSQWYLHLYKTYGGGAILNRYFITREQNFPKATNDTTIFARTMNRGEFVHFWSGTCGRNVTNLATSVFGWSTALGEQYQQALLDFKNLSY